MSDDSRAAELDVPTIFEAVDIPTIILDADGEVVVWNDAEAEVTGISREEIEGRENIGECVYDGERETILAEKVVRHPEDAHEVYNLALADEEYALLELDDHPTYEDTSTVTGGTGEDIWFIATPLYDGDEFLGVIEFTQRRADSERQRREMVKLLDELEETLVAFQEGDVTARAEYDFADSVLDPEDVEVLEGVNHLARMREALRQQVQETEEARRDLERQNERLEQFANVVSHDLKNPLTIADGYLETARADGDEEAFEKVAEAHDRMDEIIEELLRFTLSGGTVDDPDLIDLSSVAESAWKTVETGESELDLSVGGASVPAVRDQLRSVLENLFSNAVEHNDEPVTVRLGVQPSPETVELLFVEDSGQGLPADADESVFDHGYTTEDTGTGFGLSIVEEMAQAHGWEVRATESGSGGARFEFHLPG